VFMKKEELAEVDKEQKSIIAVAYLLRHVELQPEETKSLFKKLEEYDKGARNIQATIREAQKSITELRSNMDQVIGSITAVSELISEKIPPEKIDEFCLAYTPPMEVQTAMRRPVPRPSAEPDMAGSTAKKLPPMQPLKGDIK